MKKNGFAPVLVILVIVILGAVGYFAYKNYYQPAKIIEITPSPQSSPTQKTGKTIVLPQLTQEEKMTWKTYTNQKYGFSVSYPGNAVFTSYDASFVINSGEIRAVGDYTGENINIAVVENRLQSSPPGEENGDVVMIDNQKAKVSLAMAGTIYYIGPVINQGFSFTFQHDISDISDNQETFFKILSTFKFIK